MCIYWHCSCQHTSMNRSIALTHSKNSVILTSYPKSITIFKFLFTKPLKVLFVWWWDAVAWDGMISLLHEVGRPLRLKHTRAWSEEEEKGRGGCSGRRASHELRVWPAAAV
jgi:hypothetical protein